MDKLAVENLRGSIDGEVITALDAGYEEARRSWNADIDRRPAAVIRCATARDVVAAIPLDGAYSDVAVEATAFSGGRSPRSFVTLVAMTAPSEQLPTERAWVREMFDALEPHLLDDGTCVNVLPENDEGHLSRSYGSKYPRLQEIKGRYDPDNVFHGNANTRPLITTL